jgi:hypothetical protein
MEYKYQTLSGDLMGRWQFYLFFNPYVDAITPKSYNFESS